MFVKEHGLVDNRRKADLPKRVLSNASENTASYVLAEFDNSSEQQRQQSFYFATWYWYIQCNLAAEINLNKQKNTQNSRV